LLAEDIMADGFFSLGDVLQVRKPLPLLPKCGECGLYRTCKSKKMVPFGKGRRKILIVGEAPGHTEDEVGRPFVGKAGQYLRQRLRKFGINPDTDCLITNALICRPIDNKITDQRMIEYCRPNLLKTLQEFDPNVVILLGGPAHKSLLGHLWKENVGAVTRWVGWKIPCQRYNCWVCPTYHPSYLMRQDNVVLDRMFEQHLEAALELADNKPWKQIPDYKSKVTVEYDPHTAAKLVRRVIKEGKPTAFDYETSALKPDGPNARIVCCSVSNGAVTVAYPWQGEAITATKELIVSDVPKIASNMKFEDRWTWKHLKCQVNNWDWDTMLAAHVLDNRPEITSIKFQAFVRLGVEPYNDHIAPYLESKEPGGNSLNRIKEVDMNDLLVYCGLDSLLEWKVAKAQKEEMEWTK
jgi:uracil-DNA glycosylase